MSSVGKMLTPSIASDEPGVRTFQQDMEHLTNHFIRQGLEQPHRKQSSLPGLAFCMNHSSARAPVY